MNILKLKQQYRSYIIVSDIHGCQQEFQQMLRETEFDQNKDLLISVGDLADRGPRNAMIYQWFLNASRGKKGKDHGYGIAVLGNHDDKLLRHMMGRPVTLHPGFKKTIEDIALQNCVDLESFPNITANINPWFEQAIYYFLKSLPLVIEGPDFYVVHGGLNLGLAETSPNEFPNLCIRGETKGERHPDGYPIRTYDWVHEYHGVKDIVHGHDMFPDAPRVLNTQTKAKVYGIDGACVYGGNLVAIRYPDKKIFKVKAKQEYYPREIG